MRFDTTSWSVILKATVGGSAEASQALATLCETYWLPVYVFIRRKGHSAADAEDFTQGYFSRFPEKAYVTDFRAEAGRFRTFVCASGQHFLANERDRGAGPEARWRTRTALAGRGGRGGALPRRALDNVTPETLFERQWAAAMLARCLRRLREAEGSSGRERFDWLKPFLGADGPESRYAELARALGTSESAARVAAHRLRRRFGQVLREEVARTVVDPGEVDAELRWLLTTVRGQG